MKVIKRCKKISLRNEGSIIGIIGLTKLFICINELLKKGWKVSHLTPSIIEIDKSEKPEQRETLVAFVLLEKPDEQK